jgi:ribosome-associated protein
LHLVERWRDRLLQEEDALTQLASEYPNADVSQIRLLIKNAARERASVQPPKSYRALFKLLNELIGDARGP